MRMIVLLLEECPLKIEEDTGEVIGVMAVLVVAYILYNVGNH
jgi:hypothetical protein